MRDIDALVQPNSSVSGTLFRQSLSSNYTSNILTSQLQIDLVVTKYKYYRCDYILSQRRQTNKLHYYFHSRHSYSHSAKLHKKRSLLSFCHQAPFTYQGSHDLNDITSTTYHIDIGGTADQG